MESPSLLDPGPGSLVMVGSGMEGAPVVCPVLGTSPEAESDAPESFPPLAAVSDGTSTGPFPPDSEAPADPVGPSPRASAPSFPAALKELSPGRDSRGSSSPTAQAANMKGAQIASIRAESRVPAARRANEGLPVLIGLIFDFPRITVPCGGDRHLVNIQARPLPPLARGDGQGASYRSCSWSSDLLDDAEAPSPD